MNEKEGDRLILDIKIYTSSSFIWLIQSLFIMKILDQLKIYIIDLTKYTQNSTVILNHHALIFVWAKKYINENSEFRRYRRDASHVSEYETLINSIFDIIYYEDENIHYALRKNYLTRGIKKAP